MSTSPLFSSTTSQQRLGIAILRIIAGIVFTVHGYQKLFTYGISGVQGAFTKMGVPMATLTGPLVACLEFFGGIALIIGLLTRLVALGFAIEMIGAILTVHLANGFFMPMGYEFALTLATASLTLVLAGPGSLSVDDMIARRN